MYFSSSAFSLYLGGNAYVIAFDFPPFRWPHSDFGKKSECTKKREEKAKKQQFGRRLDTILGPLHQKSVALPTEL
jgi:hypothetical protein